MKKKFILLLLFAFIASYLKAQKITLLQQDKPTSIRGLSVVNGKVAWVSGSKGYIARTTNGGKTWNWMQVKGFEKTDFRSIEAFSNKEAIIMSSGTPALILKTNDGGENWQLKYKNIDTTYFLDAMDFTDKKHGVVLGDPINNKFLLLETDDYGETWHPFKNVPEAMIGEACFAASGTCLRLNNKEIHIVTGGTQSRHLIFDIKTKKWFTQSLPIARGESSKGAFSISIEHGWVVVGGNYAKNKIADSTACYFTGDIMGIYHPSYIGPKGYQSCVEAIGNTIHLSTGTSGSNISYDGGKTWSKIDNGSFNVCRNAKSGNLVLLAGDKGRIAIFQP